MVGNNRGDSMLAWASSGLLYAWPNTIEGGKIENIRALSVRITPAERCPGKCFAGQQLPTTALNVAMRRVAVSSVGAWRRIAFD